MLHGRRSDGVTEYVYPVPMVRSRQDDTASFHGRINGLTQGAKNRKMTTTGDPSIFESQCMKTSDDYDPTCTPRDDKPFDATVLMCNICLGSRLLVPVAAGMSFNANNYLSPLFTVGKGGFDWNCVKEGRAPDVKPSHLPPYTCRQLHAPFRSTGLLVSSTVWSTSRWPRPLYESTLSSIGYDSEPVHMCDSTGGVDGTTTFISVNGSAADIEASLTEMSFISSVACLSPHPLTLCPRPPSMTAASSLDITACRSRDRVGVADLAEHDSPPVFETLLPCTQVPLLHDIQDGPASISPCLQPLPLPGFGHPFISGKASCGLNSDQVLFAESEPLVSFDRAVLHSSSPLPKRVEQAPQVRSVNNLFDDDINAGSSYLMEPSQNLDLNPFSCYNSSVDVFDFSVATLSLSSLQNVIDAYALQFGAKDANEEEYFERAGSFQDSSDGSTPATITVCPGPSIQPVFDVPSIEVSAVLESLLGNLCRSQVNMSPRFCVFRFASSFEPLPSALDDTVLCGAFYATTASHVKGRLPELSQYFNACQLCLHSNLTLCFWTSPAAVLPLLHSVCTPPVSERVQPVRPTTWEFLPAVQALHL